MRTQKMTTTSMKNQKGASLLVSTLLLVAIGVAGLKTIELSSEEAIKSASDINVKKAENYAYSGIESALYDLQNGANPAKTIQLDDGTVTISTDTVNQTVTVEGRVGMDFVGDAVRTYQVDGVFSKEVFSVNASHAAFENTADGGYLTGIYIEKSEDETKSDIIDKLTLSWNESYCARQVTCLEAQATTPTYDGEIDYTAYEDPDNADKILICHIPQGNTSNPRTISISKNAWEDRHSAHDGDYLGACGTAETQNDAGQEQVIEICELEDLDASEQYELENYCTTTDGGKKVDEVVFAGQTLFDASETDVEAASSAQEIDLDDYTMTDAGTYEFDGIRLDGDIDDGTWFTLTVHFKDGSSVNQQFQAISRDVDLDLIAQEESDVQQGSIAEGADFEEDNGTVTISAQDNYVLEAEILATEITCGENGPYVPVYVDIAKNNQYQGAFGDTAVQLGDKAVIENLQEQNDYIVKATAAMASCNNFTNTQFSTSALTYSLVNDDAVPSNWDGFGGQQTVTEVLAAYIGDDDLIELADNQVIMLFELGTTDSGSSSADYQDLVVLITVNLQ